MSLLAFWALETDFGQVQGDFNTLNSLMTLSHDCRRPELFQPQVFSALELFRRGDFDPRGTTGAWAGEIGMVQMLPGDIIEYGRDGDGDGHVQLKNSVADALMSGAAMLRGTVYGLLLEERLMTRFGRGWFRSEAARDDLREIWDAEPGQTAESMAASLDLGTIDAAPMLDRCRP